MRGDVDVLDFISCLCLHTVELQKLRTNLKPLSRVLPLVSQTLEKKKQPGADADALDHALLTNLALFTGHVFQGLRMLWPGRVAESIMDAMVHHGDYSIFVASNLGLLSSHCQDVH